MAGAALAAKGLTKRYRTSGGATLLALDAFDLEVRPGEIVGLLGPNGAGKTTALQLCLKLLHADAGEVRMFGDDPEALAVRRRVGYAPDAPLFPRALSGQDVLELHADLLDVERARIEPLAQRLGIEDILTRPCGVYSKGQSQRLGLAQALIGEPDLLFLDEPTAGLDPAGVAAMREMLLHERGRGAAVVLNSHLLSEVERVCDRVLFIKGGRVLRTHDVHAGGGQAEIRVANPDQLQGRYPVEGSRLRIPIADESAIPAVVRELVAAGAEIVEVRVAGAELEQLYLQLVEERA
jgi:ABC-2 type transport system ATP-binding protein